MWYWLIPLGSIVMQFIETRAGAGQIRPEEISESIRGPLWLAHGQIFQGLSSHIGWYAPLLVWYEFFGFSLRGAADFRFFLHIISVLCLALLLKKYLGVKIAWLPLATIVFSPTLLYFNSLATHYGVDLQYLPICLFLMASRIGWISWFVIMLAWLSYPTFLYYIPLLLFLYIKKHPKLKEILASVLCFLLPLLFGFVVVGNRNLLVFDSGDRSGLFRGAAHTIDIANGASRVRETVLGFFTTRPSYYYEVAWAEFSWIFPLIFAVIFLVFFQKKHTSFLIFICIVLVFNIITLWLYSDTSGVGFSSIRRATGLLAGFYMFLIFVLSKKQSLIVLFLLTCIPLHHLLVFFPNVKAMSSSSIYAHPQDVYDGYIQAIQHNDVELVCPYQMNTPTDCAYNRIYAIVTASCRWNNLACHHISGWDPFAAQFVRLEIPLWSHQWSWEKYDRDLFAIMRKQ